MVTEGDYMAHAGGSKANLKTVSGHVSYRPFSVNI